MQSSRLVQVGALFVAVASATGIAAAKGDNTEPFTRSYSLSDLPIWRIDSDRPVFDASAVVTLIENSVAPESWDEKGPGSISEFPAKLSIVVTQTQENHVRIGALLKQLRVNQPPRRNERPVPR